MDRKKVDVCLVGEAWGEKEEEVGKPFVGTSGWLLDQMLGAVGIDRKECLVTNCFNLRPRPNNDIKNLCGQKPLGIPGIPPLAPGKYILAQYAPELERLYDEIRAADPNIIIALGATAAWALLHSTGIRGIRGATTVTCQSVSARLGRSYKVLPTYHPAAVAREWSIRPIVIADLDKARRQSLTPEFRRPSRDIWLKPTLEDLATYDVQFIQKATILSADIETKQDQITCIGFAPSGGSCIVIPFFTESGANYWSTLTDELAAWSYVRRWLATKPTVFQNGLYDINFLWSRYGIPVPLAAEDTMLLHHAMQPELEKGLGFLGSVYTEEASWKAMGKGKKHD
jgi:uracil-DNA glycosylase